MSSSTSSSSSTSEFISFRPERERPYKCRICGKQFSLLDNADIHLESVHTTHPPPPLRAKQPSKKRPRSPTPPLKPPLPEDTAISLVDDDETDKDSDEAVAVVTEATVCTERDLETLNPCTWLNDVIVNCYLQSRAKRTFRISDQNPCVTRDLYLFETWFYNCLVHPTSGYSFQRTFTRKQRNIHIFDEYKWLMFPLNVNGNHWTLVVVHIQERQIDYVDSLRGTSSVAYIRNLVRFLCDEAYRLGYKRGEYDQDWNWSVCSRSARAPKQENTYDCGVFVCAVASRWMETLRDGERMFPERFDFDQAEIPKWREHMRNELRTNCK